MAALLRRIGFAFKCFFVVLFSGRLPAELPDEFLRDTAGGAGRAGADTASSTGATRAADAAPAPSRAPDRAVQMLALLQRDGRLVDFLYEDISGYADDQVGAAVREVHASCREALQRHLSLEPVMDGDEGSRAVVAEGFDPAAVKLVGNLTGQPPFRGVLRHHGWRAARVDLPALVEGGGSSIVAPAEVELE